MDSVAKVELVDDSHWCGYNFTVQQFKRFPSLAILLLVVLIVFGVGAYTYFLRSYCELKSVDEASASLIRQRNRYDHSYQFAVTAARDATVRPVADLQQILMDTQDVPVPVCLRTAKKELIDYMGTVIQAFNAYGAGEADLAVRDLINESQMHYDQFTKELQAVKECAPLCVR